MSDAVTAHATPDRWLSAVRQVRILDTLEGMKPLRRLLMFHDWRLMTNDEGQQYKICDRCGAYRDFTPAAGAS